MSFGAGKHVAILLPDLRGGGVERMRLQIARELLAAGAKVSLYLSLPRGELLGMVPVGCHVVGLDAPRLREVPVRLAGVLRRERPDGLLAAMWPMTGVAVAARAASPRTRVLVSEHNTLSLAYAGFRGSLAPVHRMAMRVAYSAADARVAVSTGVAHDLAKLSRLPVDRFAVIHNPAYREPLEVSSDPWPTSTALRVLTVGSLKAQKDHATLLAAIAQLSATVDVRLAVLGEGELRAELEARRDALGLRQRADFVGFVSDPRPWFAHADVFVLSSRYEGFGNVIVEALAHGVPVVSTDCPSGPAEILKNGIYGRLAPVGDPSGLADALLSVLRGDHPKADVLRARARVFAPATVARRYFDALFEERR